MGDADHAASFMQDYEIKSQEKIKSRKKSERKRVETKSEEIYVINTS